MPPAATITSMHVCPMVTGIVPHVGCPVVTGAPTVLISGLPAARVGDTLVCVGPPDTIAMGMPNVLIEGFEEGFDLDGDAGDNPTGAGVLSGDLYATDVTFSDVTLKMKNDTGVTFTEADFISGDGNGTGTDYASWGAFWTVE